VFLGVYGITSANFIMATLRYARRSFTPCPFLLLNLSRSGVGCYLGIHFTGALAYAYDIVLIAPTD